MRALQLFVTIGAATGLLAWPLVVNHGLVARRTSLLAAGGVVLVAAGALASDDLTGPVNLLMAALVWALAAFLTRQPSARYPSTLTRLFNRCVPVVTWAAGIVVALSVLATDPGEGAAASRVPRRHRRGLAARGQDVHAPAAVSWMQETVRYRLSAAVEERDRGVLLPAVLELLVPVLSEVRPVPRLLRGLSAGSDPRTDGPHAEATALHAGRPVGIRPSERGRLEPAKALVTRDPDGADRLAQLVVVRGVLRHHPLEHGCGHLAGGGPGPGERIEEAAASMAHAPARRQR